jgi:hypothetical protein
MAAVTRHYDHLRAGCLDLLHLAAAIKNPFIIVTGHQRATATAAAELIHPARIQVNPCFEALIQNPTRFVKKSVAKTFLGPAPVITGIMIGGPIFETGVIDFDAAILDVLDQQIEHRNKVEFGQNLRKVGFQPGPGCQIGMPSFGPEQGVYLEFLHLFDDTAGHDFHGRIIPCKISPRGAFPVLAHHGPVFAGGMKNFPPVLEILGMGIDQLIMDRGENIGPFFIDMDFKSFKSRVLRPLLRQRLG